MDVIKKIGVNLTLLGLLGAYFTAILGFFWAPSVDPDQWNAPEAYRIVYWHVPFAWTSFLAFCLLFIGSASWYVSRSETGWRLINVGSELGLLFGAGVIISGPIWGSVEWGVPWDWGDVRLNTYALLTALAIFLVMALRSQPDGEGTRDTLAAIGLFGFVLVPITAIATTLWRDRHPGLVIVDSEDSGIDPEIRLILMLGTISFMAIFIGLTIVIDSIHRIKSEIEQQNISKDRVGLT